ncbi:MAG: glycine--tRNA ligase, partial [Nitrososphaerota archaeon]|nr:glycine--tRNA ligase [Nitrososphaerota archaeon]
ERDVLRVSARIAPYLCAIFPLISKPEFESKAYGIYESLKIEEFSSFYDESGAIGRRYRRMDEVGTPYCITVDHQTLQDDTVTLRERDSMSQERIAIGELASRLRRLRDA